MRHMIHGSPVLNPQRQSTEGMRLPFIYRPESQEIFHHDALNLPRHDLSVLTRFAEEITGQDTDVSCSYWLISNRSRIDAIYTWIWQVLCPDTSWKSRKIVWFSAIRVSSTVLFHFVRSLVRVDFKLGLQFSLIKQSLFAWYSRSRQRKNNTNIRKEEQQTVWHKQSSKKTERKRKEIKSVNKIKRRDDDDEGCSQGSSGGKKRGRREKALDWQSNHFLRWRLNQQTVSLFRFFGEKTKGRVDGKKKRENEREREKEKVHETENFHSLPFVRRVLFNSVSTAHSVLFLT